jgi:hypothetical protein
MYPKYNSNMVTVRKNKINKNKNIWKASVNQFVPKSTHVKRKENPEKLKIKKDLLLFLDPPCPHFLRSSSLLPKESDNKAPCATSLPNLIPAGSFQPNEEMLTSTWPKSQSPKAEEDQI